MSRVWCNGALIDGPLPLDPRDRGLLLGDGVFETILVVNGQPIWLAGHLARMGAAAAELGIGFDETRIAAAVPAPLGGAPLASLRLTLTRGAVTGGLACSGDAPTVIASLSPLPHEITFQPVRLATSTVRRNEWAPSSRLKTLSYADAIAAARAAAAAGAGDALMLNTAGFAASSTIANLFLLRGTQLVTPSLDQGILPGITRRVLLDLAPSLGLAPVERPLRADELAAADAVFLTNSLRLIRPVTALDGTPLGTRPLDDLKDALATLIRRESRSTFPQNPLGSAPL